MKAIEKNRLSALGMLAQAAVLFTASSAFAQYAPIPEKQLDSGFLGEQNQRNTYAGVPDDAPYRARAAAAIDAGEFNKALAILRLNKMTAFSPDYLMKGQAHVGLGDYVAARKDYQTAIKKDPSWVLPQLALGEMEARYGDKVQAGIILERLKKRLDGCLSRCADGVRLAQGIGRIEGLLSSRP